MASTFRPREGRANAWITSAEVTSICTSVFTGTTARWSTSSKRNMPGLRSVVGSI